MEVLIVNGPNLNTLGTREPDIYGQVTFSEIEDSLLAEAARLGVNLTFFQSNSEGELIDKLQEAGVGGTQGIIINAGALTHYSYSLADAVKALKIPVVEVHISNIFAREEFRHTSVIAPFVAGVIAGFGPAVYSLALQALVGDIGQDIV
ncbi:MAG: type II 3-dehydroquinate dehydratase [Actinobacteria bacterium]|jgi:3-dehydroquinate dehydratase-2|nr:type II 3-dehydroquinate dehydratase [Actinomycetota bacterium]MCL6104174.1 type II 3-dehydroquinate dehydratase [Actinomycetota bacterium]